MSLERFAERYIAHVITKELKQRYPKLYGLELGKPKDGEPSKIFEGVNSQGTGVGLVEDNGKTGYLYVLDARTRVVIASCWLYNRISAPSLTEALAFADRGEAPPLPSDFQSMKYDPTWKAVTSSNISVTWNIDGTAVVAKFKKTPFGMLAWDSSNWRSYSMLINKPCQWGERLNKEDLARYSLK